MFTTKISADDTLIALGQEQLIAVLRAESSDDGIWVAERLLNEGIPCLEVTQTVPDAPGVIARLYEKFSEALIGAGSIVTLDEMKAVVEAGARFVVSPVMNEELIRYGRKKEVLTIVGAATPTEIFKAYEAGAHAVKVFPVNLLGGVDYIKAIQAPLASLNMPLIPTGGISTDNFVSYLKQGVWAVGLGSGLVSNAIIEERNELALIRAAESLLEAYNQFKIPAAATDDDATFDGNEY